MLHSIKAYVNFLLKSTNQHGVHSPFVYDLITTCFYDSTKHQEYKTLKQFRKELYNNSSPITITDFGSGSRVFNSDKRIVSKMAKTSGITSRRAKLLLRLVKYFEPNQILELGTSLGLGTSALSLGNENAHVTSIEGCPETAKIAQQQFDSFKLTTIDLTVGAFEAILPKLTSKTYDFVYIDGNHTKEATLGYFERLLPTVNNATVFVFDDIHWSEGMTEAWDIIKEHPKVTVSMDTFFWGIVCFRTEQVKEHFTIRI